MWAPNATSAFVVANFFVASRFQSAEHSNPRSEENLFLLLRDPMLYETIDSPDLQSPEQALLDSAREQALRDDLPYAGRLGPRDAWLLVQAEAAVLVDVRSIEERHFVGHVPGSIHVAWATGTTLTRNARFTKELEAKAGKLGKPILLLCRSGKRSALAAEAATKAGISDVFNISEGFEGDLDPSGQRGHFNGWRFHALPWVQD